MTISKLAICMKLTDEARRQPNLRTCVRRREKLSTETRERERQKYKMNGIEIEKTTNAPYICQMITFGCEQTERKQNEIKNTRNPLITITVNQIDPLQAPKHQRIHAYTHRIHVDMENHLNCKHINLWKYAFCSSFEMLWSPSSPSTRPPKNYDFPFVIVRRMQKRDSNSHRDRTRRWCRCCFIRLPSWMAHTHLWHLISTLTEPNCCCSLIAKQMASVTQFEYMRRSCTLIIFPPPYTIYHLPLTFAPKNVLCTSNAFYRQTFLFLLRK